MNLSISPRATGARSREGDRLGGNEVDLPSASGQRAGAEAPSSRGRDLGEIRGQIGVCSREWRRSRASRSVWPRSLREVNDSLGGRGFGEGQPPLSRAAIQERELLNCTSYNLLTSQIPVNPLPDFRPGAFLWGTATAAHQIEGGKLVGSGPHTSGILLPEPTRELSTGVRSRPLPSAPPFRSSSSVRLR